MDNPKYLASLNARSRDGSYLPFSMEMMVCLETLFRKKEAPDNSIKRPIPVMILRRAGILLLFTLITRRKQKLQLT